MALESRLRAWLARRPGGAVVTALLLCAALVLTGCSTKQVASPSPTARGGTLHLLIDQDVTAWDPQRIGSGPEGSFAIRTYLRTLTTHAPAGVGFLPGLVADLATTTGSVSDGGRTWSFPIVSDATWQDGRFVTCADVRYGVSRSFATDRMTGGSTQAVQLLDIPATTAADGSRVSAYQGPWSGVGQDLYDKAVTCTAHQITFHLNSPRYDFDEIVSLPAFAPVRKDQDTDRSDRFSVFSNGPYMLEGVWHPGEGGRFVRNRKWVGRDDPVRLAWPDVIEVTVLPAGTSVVQQIIDDTADGHTAVTWVEAPPAIYPQLVGPSLAARTTRPDSGEVDALLPNPVTPVGSNPAVRRALALSTDRQAYVAADGSAMQPVTSALPRSVPGRADDGSIRVPTSGTSATSATSATSSTVTDVTDVAGAKSVLQAAGLTLPVPLRVAYPSSGATDRAVRALATTWAAAGFAVSLVPVAAGASPAADGPSSYDLTWTSLSAAWPSGGAVLPDLVTRDAAPGRGPEPALVAEAAAAAATPDVVARNAAWSALDMRLVAAGDVLPLAARQRVLVHGSGVEAYQDNVLLGGRVDLAAIQVEHDGS